MSDGADRDGLRAAAESATPGPWSSGTPDGYSTVQAGGGYVVCDVGTRDAAFIAAANPQAVLALLDALDEVEADNSHNEWACRKNQELAEAAVARAERAEGEARLHRDHAARLQQIAEVDVDLIIAASRPSPDTSKAQCAGTLGGRPSWMSEGQYDPCRCKRTAGHEGEHACEHTDSALADAFPGSRNADAAPPAPSPDTTPAETVRAMCHWTQDRGNARSQTHTEYHFGYVCPYEAMAEVLCGRPDPRDAAPSPETTAACPRCASDVVFVYPRRGGYCVRCQRTTIPAQLFGRSVR